MKAWVSIIATALFLASFAPFTSVASAQDGMPTAGVTNVHPDGWDWGYVGVAPIFGFSLGDRFDLTGAGFTDFGTDPIMGIKTTLGVGSNEERLGTEFFLTAVGYSYSGTLINGQSYSTSQWFAKLGFNILFEFLSNETITDEGQIIKDGTLSLTGFGGFYWLTFFGDNFDLIPQDPTNDTQVLDETLWLKLGLLIEIPLGNQMSLTFHGAIDTYVYHMARIIPGFGEVDQGDITFETFTEKFQITLGGMVQFHPFLVTRGGHHWRFFVGANFIIIENPQPAQLLFSGGVNFGW